METLKNTICINGNTGNIHIRRIFFVAFVGADHNRWLWIYIIAKFRFSYCFDKGWVVVVIVRVGGGRGLDAEFWTFAGAVTKIEQVQTMGEGGPNFVILWEHNNGTLPNKARTRSLLFVIIKQWSLKILEYSPQFFSDLTVMM